MRFFWFNLLILTSLLLAGCRPRGADEPASELWLRVHAAGWRAVNASPDAAKLREIAALPASEALGRALVDRVAGVVQQTVLGNTNPPAVDAKDLIRPLLAEALTNEFVFECHGRSNAPSAWMLAVFLDDGTGAKPPPLPIAGSVTNLARRWETNYRALVARLNLGEPKKFNARSFGGWHTTLSGKRAVDYLEIGRWVIVGTGIDRRVMAAALERTDKQGRPLPPLTDSWLHIEGDLAKFGHALPLGDVLTWPRIDLHVRGRQTNLVTTAKLTFPAALTLEEAPWNVPTNQIQDPLISFTAIGDARHWFAGLPFYQRLALTNPPRQLYFWAQAQIPFQSHVAAPLPGASETLHEIARRLPLALGTNMQNRASGEIRWATNRVDLIWAGLPVVVPYLRVVKAGDGGEALFGGIFPARDTREPMPAALLEQLQRPNLVAYDWEITEERLAQWRQIWQIWALATLSTSFNTPIAQGQWLPAVGPLLGNTITEVTRSGPAELTVLRKSHAGFTGVEFLALARTLDRFISGPPPLPVPRNRPPPNP